MAGSVTGMVKARKKKAELTGGACSSARKREGAGYRFGFGFLGHGPDLELGRFVAPGPFVYFFLLTSFSFSVF
jgi:hypothetical protein